MYKLWKHWKYFELCINFFISLYKLYKHTVKHPARRELLPHTGDIVVAQDGGIKGINSFPGKFRRVSLYTYEVNDDSVKGDNFL